MINLQDFTAGIFKMDNQLGPVVQHTEPSSVLRASLDGRGFWGRLDTGICVAQSLCCSPEMTTVLLIGYTPMQNKKFKDWKKKKISQWGGHFCRKEMVEVLQNAIKAFLPGQARRSFHQEPILVCTLFYIPGYVPMSPGLQSMWTWIEFVSYCCVKLVHAKLLQSCPTLWKLYKP